MNNDWLQTAWNYAVKDAVEEIGLNKSVFPAEPIWESSQVIADDFYPDV